MAYFTDLALERRELSGCSESQGITVNESKIGSTKTTVIEVVSEEGEKAIGKPMGKYITVELEPFADDADITDERLDVIADAIRQLVPDSGAVLVAGIGNRSITPDALGPLASSRVFVTRHISRELQKQLGFEEELRPVSSVAAGVLGQTGIETGELLRAVTESVKPACVITVDALASRRLSRLGCTVQLSDTGICPGSGVGNSRVRIDKDSLGVPVIAVGIPTVVDAMTLARDVLGAGENESIASRVEPPCAGMMVTPKEIDTVIDRASRLVALAINRVLQPSLSVEALLGLTE